MTPIFVRRWVEFHGDRERLLTLEQQYQVMRSVDLVQWLVDEGYLPEQMHQQYDFRVDAMQLALEFRLPPEIETYVRLRWADEF